MSQCVCRVALLSVALAWASPSLAQQMYVAPYPTSRAQPMPTGVAYRDGTGYRAARTNLGSSSHPPFYGPAIWQGLSVGLHGTYSATTAHFAGLGAIDSANWLGGANVGWAWQWGAMVAGIEADVDLGRTSLSGGIGPGQSGRAETDWSATVRGRAGVALGNWLPFLSAGVAVAQPTLEVDSGLLRQRASPVATGFVYGGGLAWKATPTISLKGEVLRTEYGRIDVGDTRVKLDDTRFRFGLTFHFN